MQPDTLQDKQKKNAYCQTFHTVLICYVLNNKLLYIFKSANFKPKWAIQNLKNHCLNGSCLYILVI